MWMYLEQLSKARQELETIIGQYPEAADELDQLREAVDSWISLVSGSSSPSRDQMKAAYLDVSVAVTLVGAKYRGQTNRIARAAQKVDSRLQVLAMV